ncbi:MULTISPECIES: MFS transporter [Burkholderia]|jgi:predicted MFS family arabinose efflux permease|uniref:MFS transporter n=2 Tax=Burkholderia contaminans TaxID=488447 RepID=A0A1E3FGH6_9BURK|nr:MULTISPECIES: MFS transporter [Burkholderia]KKL43897.1 MFS transporter [Burkholderia contaminans LMG 23361]MBA9832422.1 MFS transporter [Burkholderia contaminans]MBA9836551.1 MFS transporter [Burkholderia contaminans]MBA9865892.1 MFS transporter [Burkholderia contaminans]MBA9908628.1 MFS transporter [Burkholderia contaminans]
MKTLSPDAALPPAGRASTFARSTLVALVVFAAITPLLLLVAPAVAGQLATQLGLSASQIGTYFFVELGAFSLATVPSYLWLGRVDARRVAAFAIALFGAGNLLTALWMPGFVALLALRAVTALGGGSLMVLCMTSAATSENSDRVYGLWVVGQLIAGAIGLFVLPHVFAAFGLRALYVALAALALLAAPLSRGFPSSLGARATPARDAAAQTPQSFVVLAIGAVLTFYLAIGSVWTFASRAATEAGLDPQSTGNVLAIASVMGIAGAALASCAGGRLARRAMLAAGYALLAASLVALAVMRHAGGYSAAIFAFKFAWTFVLPFILATVAQIDTSGRLVATLNFVIGAGLAAGPLLAGLMLDAGGTMRALFSAATAVAIVSFAALRHIDRRTHPSISTQP